MIQEELIPYLVEMTGQSDKIGLVAHLVKTLHKFTAAQSVRFFDLHQKAVMETGLGKLQVESVLFEPLSPMNHDIPLDTIPGLGKIIRQTSHLTMPFMRFETEGGEQLVFALVEGSRIRSILYLDTLHPSTTDETTARMFWNMFINLERTIRAKDQDPLTGLLNRRSFDETISNILDCAFQSSEVNRMGGDGACLAVFDIDHFKRVNDTFGHAIGDEVLILFARQMERMFRVADILYRFGGEEFLVILLEVDAEKARAALERFRESIANHHFPQVKNVTVSIGFVMVNGKDFPPELIEKADKALYYSKEHGRNQVNSFDDLVRQGLLPELLHDTADEIEVWG
ncbi:MAG: GGDEF domain-containing protein [Magnetococcales bacterium]|nr:GGDEF domain-containing protein [Magnetococcales bacterium]MBF0148633.1 GGDEF domain-containing protein [Magnetococcales bacterium]MBF0172727.1 GGDEF domain-containing protein [Magnetococcales bacterium]MBF0346866.1 GGDEF domain-containing protein [Magnetococcales bacterium]MBF0630875.1 GGDEF domain-containing protein [Magnetococcales bacterium]